MSETTTGHLSGADFKVGDLVTLDPAAGWAASALGFVYEIASVPNGRSKNYVAKPQGNPSGRGVKGPAYAFLAYEEGSNPNTIPYIPVPEMGSVVRIDGVPSIKASDLYVVLGDARNKPNAAKVVKLGGEGGRYYPAIPAKMMTVVDPATLSNG